VDSPQVPQMTTVHHRASKGARRSALPSVRDVSGRWARRFVQPLLSLLLLLVATEDSSAMAAAGSVVRAPSIDADRGSARLPMIMFASHANAQLCATLKAGVLNGHDMHLVGWNSSSRAENPNMPKEYATYVCKLPPDQLVLGGSSAFSTLFSEAARPEEFVSRFQKMHTDFVIAAGNDDGLTAGMETALNATRPHGWLDEDLEQDRDNPSRKLYACSSGWMGKAGSACQLFRKMETLSRRHRGYKKLPGANGFHENLVFRLALYQDRKHSHITKLRTLDFRNKLFYPIKDPQSWDGADEEGPLWTHVITRNEKTMKGWFTGSWFAKKTKENFQAGNPHMDDAYFTVHTDRWTKPSVKKVSDVCPYIWDPNHDWSPAELNWQFPRRPTDKNVVIEFGKLHDSAPMNKGQAAAAATSELKAQEAAVNAEATAAAAAADFERLSDSEPMNKVRALPDINLRTELATLVPYGSEALELGVRTAMFSEQLLSAHRFGHLTSIDAWQDTDRHHYIEEYGSSIKRLRPYRENNTIIRMFFDEAVAYFDNESFDFIYVDGYAHTGANEGRDFSNWWPKLKKGGLFAGHDYGTNYPLVKKFLDPFYRDKKSSKEVIGEMHLTKMPDEVEGEISWYFRKAY